jgi:hypothetical protein
MDASRKEAPAQATGTEGPGKEAKVLYELGDPFRVVNAIQRPDANWAGGSPEEGPLTLGLELFPNTLTVSLCSRG